LLVKLTATKISAERFVPPDPVQVRRVRVGVVGSTRGSSLQPILYAIRDGEVNAEICCVVSNVASSYILQRARVNNIPAHHIVGKGRVR
jgi:phosphoribosylglycinamide formyltransferase 1